MTHLHSHHDDHRFVEDLAVKSDYDLGDYLVSATEITDFASHWDPLDIHTDGALASTSHFGSIIASGVHTLAVFQRLAVSAVFARWHIVAGRALRDVQFLAPVRAGTHLRGSMTITKVGNDHPRWGRVTLDGVLGTDHGRPVLSLEMVVYVRRRPHGLSKTHPQTFNGRTP